MSRYDKSYVQYFDDQGAVLSGGLIYFYQPGTTVPLTTYSDEDQTIPNTNPVVLDAAGILSAVYFNGTAKVVVHDSNNALVREVDPDGDIYSASITIDSGGNVGIGHDSPQNLLDVEGVTFSGNDNGGVALSTLVGIGIVQFQDRAGTLVDGTLNFNNRLSFAGDTISIPEGVVPATASDTGTVGDIAFNATHLYICVATDTWVRADLASW